MQKGIHEKVQGGYGKYQGMSRSLPDFFESDWHQAQCQCAGTWVPMDIGMQIAQQYGIEALMRPIADYMPTSDSPPPAPKHNINAPGPRARKPATKADKEDASNHNDMSSTAPSPAATSAASGPKRAPRQAAKAPRRSAASNTPSAAQQAAAMHDSRSTQPSRSPSPSEDSLQSGLGSPNGSHQSEYDPMGGMGPSAKRLKADHHVQPHPHQHQLPPHPAQYTAQYNGYYGQPQGPTPQQYMQHYAPQQPPVQAQQAQAQQFGGGPARYARLILDYFVSETQQIPDFLTRPPPDFDPNVVIDDDGHTALHWACAMGRLRIVRLLLTAGADIFRANSMGQTALMRSVMFTNNYDLRKFPELFELLHRSTINIDRTDRTVFHYIVDLALQKGKTSASRYYMETVLGRLVDYPTEVADILNFQDEEGEAPLTLAARARSRSLVKLLLDYGADAKLLNKEGKSAEDYILEDERLRQPDHLPLPAAAAASGASSNHMGAAVAAAAASQQSFQSASAQKIAREAIPQMGELLSNLASSFDGELGERDKDSAQANALLGNIQQELGESEQVLSGLQSTLSSQSPSLDQLQERETQLEQQLKERMAERFRQGWAKYHADEERRKDQIQSSGAPMPADLQALYQAPADGQSSEAAMQQVRQEIEGMQETKRDLFSEVVRLAATSSQPTAQNHQVQQPSKLEQYRKLLAMGSGLPSGEVDEVVDGLMENLEESLQTVPE